MRPAAVKKAGAKYSTQGRLWQWGLFIVSGMAIGRRIVLEKIRIVENWRAKKSINW